MACESPKTLDGFGCDGVCRHYVRTGSLDFGRASGGGDDGVLTDGDGDVLILAGETGDEDDWIAYDLHANTSQ